MELRELAFAVNAGMAGGKAIDKNFPDPHKRRGVPADEWDGDPDDRPVTDVENVPFEPGEDDDWLTDFNASLPTSE